jgi:hypothetical protein
MDIERFFFCSFLFLSIDTFSSLSSDQQGAALSAFLHYIHPATNTSLNKRRSAVHVKKEFLSSCCQSSTTHTVDIPGFAF